MGFFGNPTDRVRDSLNFLVHPLSKLCVSETHLRIREKHDMQKQEWTRHVNLGRRLMVQALDTCQSTKQYRLIYQCR